MDDSGGWDDEDTGGVNISFIDQFNQLTDYEFRRVVALALLLKQLRKHRPSELIAFCLRRQAIDAPGRHREGRQRMLGNHFVRRELGFRCWAIAGRDRMPFLCQVRSPGVPAHELAR